MSRPSSRGSWPGWSASARPPPASRPTSRRPDCRVRGCGLPCSRSHLAALSPLTIISSFQKPQPARQSRTGSVRRREAAAGGRPHSSHPVFQHSRGAEQAELVVAQATRKRTSTPQKGNQHNPQSTQAQGLCRLMGGREALVRSVQRHGVVLAAHGPYTAAGAAEVVGLPVPVVSKRWGGGRIWVCCVRGEAQGGVFVGGCSCSCVSVSGVQPTIHVNPAQLLHVCGRGGGAG
jgi:hypothetical protein